MVGMQIVTIQTASQECITQRGITADCSFQNRNCCLISYPSLLTTAISCASLKPIDVSFWLEDLAGNHTTIRTCSFVQHRKFDIAKIFSGLPLLRDQRLISMVSLSADYRQLCLRLMQTADAASHDWSVHQRVWWLRDYMSAWHRFQDVETHPYKFDSWPKFDSNVQLPCSCAQAACAHAPCVHSCHRGAGL